MFALLASLILFCSSSDGSALGTAITYQGQLQDSGAAANGSYDLRFSLFDALTNGNQVGFDVTNSAVAVSNGYFIVGLDFGPGAFSSNALWLAIGVRTNSATWDFAPLTPRQPLTPVPFALFGSVLSTITSITNITNYTDVTNVTLATNLNINSLTAASISGDGSGLTGLNASNLSTGVVPISRGGTGTTTSAAAASALAVLDMNLQTGLTAFAAMSNATPAFPGQIGISDYGLPIDNEYFWQARTGARGDWNFLFSVQAGNVTFGDQTHMHYTTGQGNYLFWMDGNTNYASDETVYDSAFIVASGALKSSGSAIGPALVASDGNGGVTIQDHFPIQMVAVSPDCPDPFLWPGRAYVVQDWPQNFYVAQPAFLGLRDTNGNALYPNYVGMAEEYLNEFYLPLPTAAEFDPDTVTNKAFRVVQNPSSPNLGSTQIRSNLFLRGTIYAGGTSDFQQTFPLTTGSGQLNAASVDPSTTLSVKAVNVNGATWYSGTGSPEGSVIAGVGSIYTRTDGAPGATLYVKESGTGSTGWTAK